MKTKTNFDFAKFIKTTIKNQYFQFVLLGLFFVILQILGSAGILQVSLMRGFGKLMIFTIVSLGFFILLGFGGLASLGTAGFVGLGAYMGGYLVSYGGVPTFTTLIIIIITAIVLGVVVGFISLRIEGMYLAIVTLGLSEILVSIFKTSNHLFSNGSPDGSLAFYTSDITLFGLFELDRASVFFIIAIFFVLALFLTMNIANSPTGRAMLTMKNSESAAQTMGVGLLKYRLLSFVIATVFAMIAGFLYALYYKNIQPTTWSLALSLNVLAAVVIGGTKSIWGFLAGAFLIFGLNDIVLINVDFFVQNPDFINIVNGVLMILIVMFYPGGLSQLFYEIKYKKKLKTPSLLESLKIKKAKGDQKHE